MPTTNVIIFSKDRPFQLQEILRSFKKYVIGDYEINCIVNVGDYSDTYNKVFGSKEFFDVKFHVDGPRPFDHVLSDVIEIHSDFVLFLVDDVIIYNQVHLNHIHDVMNRDKSIFGHSLRLNPSISFCQTANVPCGISKLEHTGYSKINKYDRRSGSYDWNYPWEVSASMYRWNLAQGVVESLRSLFWEIGDIKNPNMLEAKAVPYLMAQNKTNFNTFHTYPICSILTINRVQEDYQNTLYKTDYSLEYLNSLTGTDWHFDYEKYASRVYNSVHIGDVFLVQENAVSKGR